MIFSSVQQMSRDVKESAGQRLPLYLFVYGSMIVFLACLGVTAYVFSETYLERERSRVENYAGHIYDFFSFHSRTISQEMWSRNFDSIRMRVDTIAKDVGNAKYDLILTDENQNCVFSYSTLQNHGPSSVGSGNGSAPAGGPQQQVQCKVPELLKTQIPKFSVDVPQATVESLIKTFQSSFRDNTFPFHPERRGTNFLFFTRTSQSPTLGVHSKMHEKTGNYKMGASFARVQKGARAFHFQRRTRNHHFKSRLGDPAGTKIHISKVIFEAIR